MVTLTLQHHGLKHKDTIICLNPQMINCVVETENGTEVYIGNDWYEVQEDILTVKDLIEKEINKTKIEK